MRPETDQRTRSVDDALAAHAPTRRPVTDPRRPIIPRLDQSRDDRRRTGFALVAALAVLVLLATIGSMMLRLTGIQQAGSTTAILGSRAHFAARSGIEWALYEAIASGTCPAASTTLSLTEEALSGFTVEVTCSASSHAEGSEIRTHVALRARAEFGAAGSRDHAVREVGASLVL
jgi:MSHA biogenesis protein MshP